MRSFPSEMKWKRIICLYEYIEFCQGSQWVCYGVVQGVEVLCSLQRTPACRRVAWHTSPSRCFRSSDSQVWTMRAKLEVVVLTDAELVFTHTNWEAIVVSPFHSWPRLWGKCIVGCRAFWSMSKNPSSKSIYRAPLHLLPHVRAETFLTASERGTEGVVGTGTKADLSRPAIVRFWWWTSLFPFLQRDSLKVQLSLAPGMGINIEGGLAIVVNGILGRGMKNRFAILSCLCSWS